MPKRRREKPVVEESSDDEAIVMNSPGREVLPILCDESDHEDKENQSPEDDAVMDTPESDEEWIIGN